MSLCSDCQGFSIARLREQDIPLKEDLSSLAASAEQGCTFCLMCWTRFRQDCSLGSLERWLRGEFKEFERSQDKKIWLISELQEAQEGRLHEVLGPSWSSHVQVALGREGKIHYVDLSVSADIATHAAKYIRGRYFSDSRNPNMRVSWTKGRLSDCHKYHPRCGSSLEREMPTRVIDLGPAGEGKVPNIFVTGGCPGGYMALSYCWGDGVKHEIKLKNATYPAMLEGIEEARMTKTHQEALKLARELGFRYVWIDALCIIQDNEKDWEVESGKMSDVFRNASLTLVAGRSGDSTQGFLANPSTIMLEHYRMEYSHPTAPPGTRSECYISLPRSRKIGPVEDRAWCFQEAILSRRRIVYGMGQLSFRCQERTYWEDGEIGRFESNNEGRYLFSDFDGGIADLNDAKEKVLIRWYWMVDQYCARDIFEPHDIFAALMGLARAVQRTLKCRYLAGLWEDDMFRGLLWIGRDYVLPAPLARARYTPLKRPVERNTKKPHLIGQRAIRAPSWSWASVEGPVYTSSLFRKEKYMQTYRTQANFCVRPALQNFTSWTSQEGCGVDQVRMPTCELEIYGAPKDVICSDRPVLGWSFPGRKISGLREEFGRLTNWSYSAKKIEKHGVLLVAADREPEYVVGVGIFDVREEQTRSLWCLRVVKSEGLMLHMNEEGKFRRLGIFVVEDESWFEGEPERKLSLV